jgi:ribonuclease P protein component
VAEKENLTYSFPKEERLHKKKLIQELFDNGSSFYLYPFKVLWLRTSDIEAHQVMVSVSKRRFKKAVTRNLLKRRVKEAYRLNKNQNGFHELTPSVLIAYIYTGKEAHPYRLIETKLKKSIERLTKELSSNML